MGFVNDDVLITRGNMSYLDIDGGVQAYLVLTWSASDENQNRFMTIVQALERMVGTADVCLYRIVADPAHNFGFIRCPDDDAAQYLSTHYVRIGLEKIFFDVCRQCEEMPFS